MVDFKRLGIYLGIAVFRRQLCIHITPFIWRKLYVFVPDKHLITCPADSLHPYAIFCGPFHIWNFNPNDMFEISLDVNFKALSYIPTEFYGIKRIL